MKHRYTGPAGKHRHDGKRLEEGETVDLTDAQARSFGDRFEAARETSREPKTGDRPKGGDRRGE